MYHLVQKKLDELQEHDDLYAWDWYDDPPDDQEDSNGSKCSLLLR